MFLSSAAVTPQCVQVLLVADDILERNQVFVAQIDSSVPDVAHRPGEQFATVTIIDGNGKPIMFECRYVYVYVCGCGYIVEMVSSLMYRYSYAHTVGGIRFDQTLYTTSEDDTTVSVCVDLSQLPTGGLEAELEVFISLASSAKAGEMHHDYN